MKVNELPEGTNLTMVRVILPDDVLEMYKNYAGGEKEMYIVGNTMGDFFLSPHPKSKDGKGKRRLYPMPLGVEPPHILEWEVAECLSEEDLFDGVEGEYIEKDEE